MGNQVYKNLHELDHVDSSFNSVDNDFVYPKTLDDIFGTDANEYQQSIQMFIIISAVCGCIGIVVVAVIAAVINCCYNDDDDDGSDLKTVAWAKYIRWFLSVLVLITIIITFVYVSSLDGSVQTVQDTINDSYEPFGAFIDSATAIDDTLSLGINETNVIQAKSSDATVDGYAQSIKDDLEQSQSSVTEFLDDADDINWENSGDSLDSAREAVVGVGIGLACFTLVLLVLSLLSAAISTKVACCSAFISVLIVFAMLVVWIIGSVQFGVSVEVADICSNPEGAIVQIINQTSLTIGSFNNDTVPIVKYYVYCDSDNSYNPLIKEINKAYDSLIAMNSSLAELKLYAQGSNVEGNVDRLGTYYDSALVEVVALNATLKCDDINGYYVDLRDLMCDDLLDNWYGFYVSQWVTVGFLLLGLCFSCKNSVHRRMSQHFV